MQLASIMIPIRHTASCHYGEDAGEVMGALGWTREPGGDAMDASQTASGKRFGLPITILVGVLNIKR